MRKTKIYGRSIEEWLHYDMLPLFFGTRLYILKLNEVKVVPSTFCSSRSRRDYVYRS